MRLYQRGKRGTWWVDLGDVAGQRARRSTGTSDYAQAKEYAATLARDLWRVRRLGETPRVTWDAAVLAWLEEHQHRRSIEEIKRVLRWLSQHLRGMALADITDTVIRKVRSARAAEAVNRREIERAVEAGTTKPPAKLTSGATVNRHLAQLSAPSAGRGSRATRPTSCWPGCRRTCARWPPSPWPRACASPTSGC